MLYLNYWTDLLNGQEDDRLRPIDDVCVLPPVLDDCNGYRMAIFRKNYVIGINLEFRSIDGTTKVWYSYASSSAMAALLIKYAASTIKIASSVLEIQPRSFDVDSIKESIAFFSELRFMNADQDHAFMALLSELPRVWSYGRTLSITFCTDQLLMMVAKLNSLHSLWITAWNVTAQGWEQFVDLMREGDGQLAEIRVFGSAQLGGDNLYRVLSLPSLTHAIVQGCYGGVADVSRLLASSDGEHLRSLELDQLMVDPDPVSELEALTEALRVNEGLITFYWSRGAARVLLPEMNVRIQDGGDWDPVLERNRIWHQQWRSRLRCLVATVDDVEALVPEAWLPDLSLRIEQEAVRLQKLALVD